MKKLRLFIVQSIIWLIFTSTSPFIFYKLIPYHPYKLGVFIGLGFIIGFFVVKKKIRNFDRPIVVILGIQILTSVAFFCLHYFKLGADIKYINLAIQFITDLLLYLFISTYFDMLKLIKTNIYFISWMAFLGACVFVLLSLGYWHSFGSFIGPTWETQNYIFTTAGAVWQFENISVIRVGGFFDEPGTFAYYITFALLFNKLLDFSKRLEYTLILCGLLTFSVAFLISVTVYLVFLYLNLRNLKYFISLVFLVFLFLKLLDNNKSDSIFLNFISIMSVDRLLSSESDGKVISGDTRSEPTLLAMNAFLDAPLLGNGMSVSEQPGSNYYKMFIGANGFTPFAYHGIIGVSIFYFMYIYWTLFCFKMYIIRPNRILLGSWLVIFLNLLQRPDAFIGTYGYMVFIFLIYSVKQFQIKFHEKKN